MKFSGFSLIVLFNVMACTFAGEDCQYDILDPGDPQAIRLGKEVLMNFNEGKDPIEHYELKRINSVFNFCENNTYTIKLIVKSLFDDKNCTVEMTDPPGAEKPTVENINCEDVPDISDDPDVKEAMKSVIRWINEKVKDRGIKYTESDVSVVNIERSFIPPYTKYTTFDTQFKLGTTLEACYFKVVDDKDGEKYVVTQANCPL